MSDKITFSDLVKAFAETHDITQTKAEQFIRQVFEYVVDDLEADGKASITNFGSFELKEVAERTGVNPQTGEEIIIPTHNKVSFRPYKALEKTVNAEFAHLESRLIEETSDEKTKAAVPPLEAPDEVDDDEDFDDPFGLDNSGGQDAEDLAEPDEEEEPIAIRTSEEIEDDDDEEETASPPPIYRAKDRNQGSSASAWIWIVLILIVAVAGIWFFFLRDSDTVTSENQVADNAPAQVEETQQPAVEPEEETPEQEEAQPEPTEEEPEAPTQDEVNEAPKKPAFSTYIIEKDEWMWDISREVYGESYLWPLIFEANKKVTDNPNLVEPSNTLMIPGLEGTAKNLTKEDYAKLASATKMVSEAYANAGNQSRADEYLRFSKKYERNSRE